MCRPSLPVKGQSALSEGLHCLGYLISVLTIRSYALLITNKNQFNKIMGFRNFTVDVNT